MAAGLPAVRRPAGEEIQKHSLGRGAQVQPGGGGWELGGGLSARDTGISVLNGGSSHPWLPAELVAPCLAEATSLGAAGGRFIKCSVCGPSLPGSTLAPPCLALSSPFIGIKPLALIPDTSRSSRDSPTGRRFSWPVTPRVRPSKALAHFARQPGVAAVAGGEAVLGQPSCQGRREPSLRYGEAQGLVGSPGSSGLARSSLGIRVILLGDVI